MTYDVGAPALSRTVNANVTGLSPRPDLCSARGATCGADFEGIPLRVVRADYLAVIALSVGRAKDYARILALLESDSATREQIARLAARHGLSEAWDRFEARFADD